MQQKFLYSFLPSLGLFPYEISNFAKSSKAYSLGNLIYWKYRPYIGIGVSAHSFFAKKRWTNPSSWAYYQRGEIHIEDAEPLKEIPMMGFRLFSYQSFSTLKKYFPAYLFPTFYNFLKEKEKKGWVKIFPRGFQIQKKSAFFLNSFILESWDILCPKNFL